MTAEQSFTEALAAIIRPIVEEAIKQALNGHRADPLLTPEELAERLQVPESWVYEQSRMNKIPTRHIGRYVRFDFREVLDTLKKNEEPSCHG